MRKLLLVMILLFSVTLISSQKRSVVKGADLQHSLHRFNESLGELDKVLKNGKSQ